MYLPYKPISKNPENSTYVPAELQASQLQGIASLPKAVVDSWDEDIANALDLNKETLWKNFSAEQIDSIGLVMHNFKKDKAFIIADETGIGKGRILGGMCRWAFSQGLKVIFVTERESLLSDFYRDLMDTNAIELMKNPKILHSSTKVFNPNGEVVLKGVAKDVKLMESEGIPSDTNLVLTCYSQISSVGHKKTRLEFLSQYIKDSVIILDESHNATGTSNTKEFLVELLKQTNKIVFSSATFIKDESQLELYQRCLTFDEDTIELFKKLMKDGRQNTLRKVFTYELTKNLQFWRREHQPLSVGWNSVVVPRNLYQDELVDSYSRIINGMFQIAKIMNETPEYASLDMLNTWYSHGATVNRLSRNLILLLKIPTLADAIEQSLNNNHKSVVVIDSTFASLINKVIEHQDLKKNKVKKDEDSTEDENDVAENVDVVDGTYDLNLGTVLESVIDDVVGNVLKSRGATSELISRYQDLLEETKKFQDLFISPIDQLTEILAERGIKTNEISGRTFKVVNGNQVQNIKKRPKALIVKEFNDGEVDVIILTRAGASGLSLHASATFKDQRVRDFYELEITTRPTYRLQFLGRVNRKNQVVEPLFYSVITQLPFEQRILNMEKQKVAKMQSHVSGDEEKLEQENIHNFYTDYCNAATEKFLRQNFEFAKQMGISLKNDAKELYFIDSLLKRCIVLSSAQQNSLYDFLIYAVECEKLLSKNINNGISSKIDGINTFWHLLDVKKQEEFKKKYQHLPNATINQFDYPWVGLMKLTTTYKTKFLLPSRLQDEFENNFQSNEYIRRHLESVLQHLSYKGLYAHQFLMSHVNPTLRMINIGSLVSMENSDGRIFGYIHNITVPPIKNASAYTELCIFQIKTVNPRNQVSIHYSNEDYYISLKDLIEAKHISIKNQPINWKLFERYDETYERTQQCLVGHPIYVEFIKSAYDLGTTVYKEIGDKRAMYVVLPDTLSEAKLRAMKKPFYKSAKIMDALIAKNITHLSTSWEPAEAGIVAGMTIEPTTGGYLLRIIDDVYKDNNFMDFPMRTKFSKMTQKRGFSSGYHHFLVGYKEMRRVLFMMEIRDVIWFASKGSF